MDIDHSCSYELIQCLIGTVCGIKTWRHNIYTKI